jgi:hypothetical protein
MELAMQQGRGFAREQIMEKQLLANREDKGAVAAFRKPGAPKELVKRMKSAISTNIDLYGRQKEN